MTNREHATFNHALTNLSHLGLPIAYDVEPPATGFFRVEIVNFKTLQQNQVTKTRFHVCFQVRHEVLKPVTTESDVTGSLTVTVPKHAS